MDCSCDRCQSLCHNKPGWFTPDQIDAVARKLSLTVEDLFQTYLTIDTVMIATSGGAMGVYVLAPAILGKPSGSISRPKERGACIWLKGGRCGIHEIKPRECALVDHTTSAREANLLRLSIVNQWREAKNLPQRLYGKKLKLPAALRQEYRKARRARSP
jgi:Fe-S-cluster containining protein